MSFVVTPLVTDTDAFVVRLNPVTKLAAGFVVMVGLLLTADVLTPAILLAVELLVVQASGIRWRQLATRAWPLGLAVAGLSLSTLLFTEDRSGPTVLELGGLVVTTGSLLAALAISLRVIAIALPGILAFATTDPTEFADALVEHLRAPARFTFGALAAFRLFPLLGDEWRTLMMARRARGIDAGRSPIRHLRLFGSAVFGLLVAAIRRGVRLAAAMDARGFGHRTHRTLARPKPLRAADWTFMALSVAITAAATLISMAAGTWRFFLWI